MLLLVYLIGHNLCNITKLLLLQTGKNLQVLKISMNNKFVTLWTLWNGIVQLYLPNRLLNLVGNVVSRPILSAHILPSIRTDMGRSTKFTIAIPTLNLLPRAVQKYTLSFQYTLAINCLFGLNLYKHNHTWVLVIFSSFLLVLPIHI